MSKNTTPSPAQPLKRLRLFAGPCGSGKSSIFRAIAGQHNVGVYVSAEELQDELVSHQGLLLRRFHSSLNGDDLRAFYARHPLRLSLGDGYAFSVSADGRATLSETAPSSQRMADAAALVADYVRTRLIEAPESLSCETELSLPSELELVRLAKERGYLVYLYYICVASPAISKQRVAIRVRHGGHAVPDGKIAENYERSLALLRDSVALSDRAYLFDNTYSGAALKLEIRQASDVTAHETQLPAWITRNLPALVPRT